MSSQRVSMSSLNNHSLLRRSTSRLTSTSRPRNDRSQSPTNRGCFNPRALTPSGDNLERNIGSPLGSTPVDSNLQPALTATSEFTLSSARRVLGGGEVAFLETLAMNAGLDPVHREYAQYISEANGMVAQHIAHSVVEARILFNISKLSDTVSRISDKLDEVSSTLEKQVSSVSTPNGPSANASVAWVCSPELHELIAGLSARLIVSPNLEAYTALEVNRVWLAHSLFSSIRNRINQQPAEWKQQHLPGGTAGVQDGVGTRLLNTHIRNVCKHTREKLHNLLLSGIYDPKTGEVVDSPVPNLKLLWHRIANRMGIAGAHAEANTLWAHTDEPTRARMAYLRREAVRIVQIGRGLSSVWACVDKQLAVLRSKGEDYTAAFYKIVYDQDIEAFNFKNYFQDLKESCEFALPDDQTVEDSIGQEDEA